MKVMVLGSSGMAGHMITAALKRANISVINYARAPVFSDTRYLDLGQVNTYIETYKPDLVINCVGMLVQASKENPTDANYMNNIFPKSTAKYCSDNGVKFIHLSTDCVFSGETKTWYNESDTPDATDTYGVSKARGEGCKWDGLVIRTSIIGPEIRKVPNPGLFEWFRNSKGPVLGWDHAIWSGVTTYELAKYIIYLINKGLPNCRGILHLCNNEWISKYQLLNVIKLAYDKDIQVDRVVGAKKINKYIKTMSLEEEYIVPSYIAQIYQMQDHYEELRNEA